MQRYKNHSGNSGVKAYEIKETAIRVQFSKGDIYTYSYSSAGRDAVEAMKDLAKKGKGLSTYISKYLKDNYER